jgi:hypothetical protein
MAANFNVLLNVNSDNAREVPPLPMGTYIAKIGQYSYREPKGQMNVGVITLPLKIISAHDDVDHEQLQEYLAENNFAVAKVSKDIFLEDSEVPEIAINPVIKFLRDVVKIDVAGCSFKEALARTNGTQIYVHIVHKQRADGSKVDMRVDSCAPIES